MRINVTKKNHLLNLTFTGLLAAVVFVGFCISIRIPLPGAKAQIAFGNVFGILSGLLLGPVYGGAAAGIGGFVYDLVSGWADSAVITLITKFIMGFVAGWIAWAGKEQVLPSLRRTIVAAVSGSFVYCLLYLGYGYVEQMLLGSSEEALQYIMGVKVVVTFVNAVLADAIAVPLYFAVRTPLSKGKLLYTKIE